jgi:uncharacterized protein (DUF58 family)
MSIYPTRTAAHLSIVGLVVFVAGIALREAAVVAWGGALLCAIALGRAVTLVSVMRIRAAGFEMLWTGAARVQRTHPGGVVTLRAEVRNRDTLSARYDKLRVVASPALQTWVEPLAGEVPATGSVKLDIHVRALRVGYHGIYGLALEVRGAPGLFEVPLTFANPFGVEVLPRALARPLALPQGGRSQTVAASGRAGKQRGDGSELFELRELMPGDSFRRIAWKASAKRGQVVVKEFEREERDVVMLALDASVELWSGPMGGAPLDRAIDTAATLALHHIARGDLVGVSIFGGRELVRVAPDTGRAQASRVVAALIEHSGVLAADRSGWDESDMAVQVTEHLRPLDPRAVHDLRRNRIDKLVRRASSMLGHAPFSRPPPEGRTPRDSRLRHYAACFGMHVPARLEPDRGRATATLATIFADLAKSSRRRRSTKVSVVHVIAPPPPDSAFDELVPALRRLKARGVTLRWTTPPVATALETIHDELPQVEVEGAIPQLPQTSILPVVERTVVMRAAIANRQGEQALRRLGVKIVRAARSPRPLSPDKAPDKAPGKSPGEPPGKSPRPEPGGSDDAAA